MSAYSSTFNEIIVNSSLKNDFISFWNKTANTLHNDFMPVEVVLNSTDIAIMKPQITALQNTVQYIDADITNASIYINELQGFFTHFKSSIYIGDANGAEFNYDVLLNGVPNNSVAEIQTYITALKSFFNAFKENIYLSMENGSEINYSKLV